MGTTIGSRRVLEAHRNETVWLQQMQEEEGLSTFSRLAWGQGTRMGAAAQGKGYWAKLSDLRDWGQKPFKMGVMCGKSGPCCKAESEELRKHKQTRTSMCPITLLLQPLPFWPVFLPSLTSSFFSSFPFFLLPSFSPFLPPPMPGIVRSPENETFSSLLTGSCVLKGSDQSSGPALPVLHQYLASPRLSGQGRTMETGLSLVSASISSPPSLC